MSQTGHSQAGMSQGFSQGMSQGMYPSQGVMGFSQDIPDISQHDSGQLKNLFGFAGGYNSRWTLIRSFDFFFELIKGWGPRSQLDVLSQDPDYSAYHVQGDRGIDFSQY